MARLPGELSGALGMTPNANPTTTRPRLAVAFLTLAGTTAIPTGAVLAGGEPPTDAPVEASPPAKEPVSADPELNDPSVDRQLDAMRKRNASTKVVAPKGTASSPTSPPAAGQSADPVPGMAASDFGVPGARRFREGAFISRRPGALVRIPSGEWVFVPRPLAEPKGEEDRPARAAFVDRPLIVLPSQTLERLETAMATIEAGHGKPSAVLSGQIFSYRDREYLLTQQPSSLATAGAEASGASTQAPPPAGKSHPATAPIGDLDQQAVKDLIRDLESQRTSPRALTRSGTALSSAKAGPEKSRPSGGHVPEALPRGDAAASPEKTGHADDRSKSLVPEGTILTSRRGRVVRLAGGELAFSVDNDGQSGAEPPMTLLPSATLQRLEDLVLWRGERQAVEVSGRTTSYGGKNYLMPTMFVVPPPTELGPLQ